MCRDAFTIIALDTYMMSCKYNWSTSGTEQSKLKIFLLFWVKISNVISATGLHLGMKTDCKMWGLQLK